MQRNRIARLPFGSTPPTVWNSRVVFLLCKDVPQTPGGSGKEVPMNTDVVIIGAGPAGIFTALEMLKKGSRKRILIVEKGQGCGGPPLPQGEDQEVRQLQALLPHHHRLFRRGSLLRRQALPELRGGRRPAHPHRRGEGPGDHPLHRPDLPGIRRGHPHRGAGARGGAEGHPQAGHPGGAEAGGLPHPPPGHREGPEPVLRHRAVPAGARGGAPLRL